jgi:hypothetical protein
MQLRPLQRDRTDKPIFISLFTTSQRTRKIGYFITHNDNRVTIGRQRISGTAKQRFTARWLRRKSAPYGQNKGQREKDISSFHNRLFINEK